MVAKRLSPSSAALAVIIGVAIGGGLVALAHAQGAAPPVATPHVSARIPAKDFMDVAKEISTNVPVPPGTSILPASILPMATTYDDIQSTVVFRAECLWLSGLLSRFVTDSAAAEAMDQLEELDVAGYGVGDRRAAVERSDISALYEHVDINCEDLLTDQVGYGETNS